MTYQEIYDTVISLTNHPELVAETATAVQAATLRMHQTDFYERDITEAKIVLEADGYIQQVDISGVFARYRSLKYLRKWNPTGADPFTQQLTGAAGPFLTILNADQILDGYGLEKPNVAYIAGRMLNIRSNTVLRQLLAGWYQLPKVTPTTEYSSWIADTVPFAIIFDACSLIFQMIALQEQSRKFDSLVAEQAAMVKMHGIEMRGR